MERNVQTMFADAHLHMTDPEFGEGYADIKDSVLLFSCASSSKEWSGLSRISSTDGRIIPFYGTHPWYVDAYTGKDDLAHILDSDPKANVGEIGLDSKHGKLDEQTVPFREQLETAERYGRIAAIHIVGAENETLSEIRSFKVRTVLHSYSCPHTYTSAFARCGCYFSISPRIFSRPAEKVSAILRSIPPDRLLIETDAPGRLGDGFTMYGHAQDVGRAIGMTAEELLQLTTKNAERLLSE